MDIVKFLSDQWSLVSSAPVAFATYALLLFGLGFAAGKLFYGTVAEVAKARLEAARDDLARLERRTADETKDATFLRAEVAALRADVEGAPEITAVTGPPTTWTGKEGDLYIQLEVLPSGAILEASLFLTPPECTLQQALVRAAADRKPIFLVIYDPLHPTKSKLAYSLGYFLEYETTRRLVAEYFVAALVPRSAELSANLVPSDDPLENARWVVLSQDGQVLRTEGLYANADEGMKRTREAIAIAEKRSSEV